MDRNVVSYEALTSVTGCTLLKLHWVTGQINDDHNDDVENITIEENADYALFFTLMNQHKVKTILRTCHPNQMIRQ